MSWNSPEKVFVCGVCDMEVMQKDMLHAPSPFDPEETLIGCPHCKVCSGEGSWDEQCEVEGCGRGATCGTPLKGGGYLRCCGIHYREVQKDE